MRQIYIGDLSVTDILLGDDFERLPFLRWIVFLYIPIYRCTSHFKLRVDNLFGLYQNHTLFPDRLVVAIGRIVSERRIKIMVTIYYSTPNRVGRCVFASLSVASLAAKPRLQT